MMGYTLKRRIAIIIGRNRGSQAQKVLCRTINPKAKYGKPILRGYCWDVGEPVIFNTRDEAERMAKAIDAVPHRRYIYRIEKVN